MDGDGVESRVGLHEGHRERVEAGGKTRQKQHGEPSDPSAEDASVSATLLGACLRRPRLLGGKEAGLVLDTCRTKKSQAGRIYGGHCLVQHYPFAVMNDESSSDPLRSVSALCAVLWT